MKKFFKPLSILLVLGLVACSGRSISKEEAIVILDSIKAKETAGEIEAASAWRLEQKTEMTVEKKSGGDKSTTKTQLIVAVDGDGKKAYFKEYTKDVEESTTEKWLYLNEQKLFFLTSDEDGKTYHTENAGESGDVAFKIAAAFYELEATHVTAFHKASTTKSLLQGLGSTTGISKVLSESYKTKGDGNVSIDISFAPKATLGVVSGRVDVRYTYDNYLFTTYYTDDLRTTSIDSTKSKDDVVMIYGKANISLPNIKDFNLVS